MRRNLIVLFALLLSGCSSLQEHKIPNPKNILEMNGIKDIKDLGKKATLSPVKISAKLIEFKRLDQRRIVSPTNFMYFKGNRCFNKKDFDNAIKWYTKFLERAPKSDLVTPAKLNLGMSYYYTENYKDSYLTLKDIKVEDENINIFVKNTLETCKIYAADDIAAEEQKTAKLKIEKNRPKGGHIRIEVASAYLDDFESVVLTGKLDKKAIVTLNGAKATVKGNNEFSGTASWKKGTAINITAKDETGNFGELNYFPDGEAPDRPENLRTINITSNSVEIEWDPDDEEEADIRGYKFYHRLQGESFREETHLVTGLKYELVGLQHHIQGANKTFEFYIRAVDKMNNESDPSDTLEVTLP